MQQIRKAIGGLGNLMFKQAYLVGQAVEGKIPDIYVQSEKYWRHCAATVRQMYSDGIGPTINAVSLHIRRGDYVNNGFYVNLWETDYYKKAIAKFPNEKFIVFCRDNQNWETDKADRQWCRENLGPLLGDRFELPPKENTESEDLNLMASCKHNIMANSSFSWWAAYLNPNLDKIVICPKAWFTDSVQRLDPQPTWTFI